MTIIEELEALHQCYLAEKDKRKAKYQSKISQIRAQISAVESKDYADEYRQTYTASLQTLENIFADIASVQRRTRGIQFRVGEYIERCQPRTFAKGGVEDHFAKLVTECRGAIQAVSNSSDVDADIAPLKTFAQGLVDLRYIEKNATRLLKESGIPQQEQREDLAPLKEQEKAALAEYESAMEFSAFDCYADALALKEKILAQKEQSKEELLGVRTPGFTGSYQFLIGFAVREIAKEIKDFAKKFLNINEEDLAQEPVYFNLSPERDTLLIRAKQRYFTTLEFDDFMCNFYFSVATRLPPKALQYCGIECDTMDAVVGEIADRIHDYDPTCLFHSVIRREHEIAAHDGILTQLSDLGYENTLVQKKQKTQSIFEYNEKFPDNPQKFVMFCINNYPAGFNRSTGDSINTLKKIVNAGAKGVISVICEATDAEYQDNAPMFGAEELQADSLEITDDGRVLYNGNEIVLNITAEDFNRNDYWETVGQYLKSAESKTLESLLSGAKYTTDPDYITIPIGNRDGDPYALQIKKHSNQLFGMIIGTVGSGKSSFLHTLLLSAAYVNSPDDLEFYLADFKSGEDSAAFACYRKQTGTENLYLPHIRYLLLKGKTECAMDLLNKMEAMRNQRERLIKSLGCANVEEYNRHPEVTSGKRAKIPHSIFVIDEYNAMLTGLHDEGAGTPNIDGTDILTMIINKVKGLIGTLRSYGIGMLFCGQSVERSMKSSQALGNMGLRISLVVNTDNELISLFDMDSYEAKKQMKLLAGYGDALIAVGKPDSYTYVRTAYSGKENGAQQMRLAKSIREKYHDPKFDTPEYAQVDAGREDAVAVSELSYLESAYTPQEKEIALDMGVSGASGLRVPLVYSTEDSASNYLAFSTPEKLAQVERNAMLAFAKYAKEKGLATEGPVISYLALPQHQEKCWGKLLDRHPVLYDYIDPKDTLTDMAIQIMKLRHLYQERKKEADRGIRREFDPVLLVLHNFAWVSDSDAAWLPDFSKSENTSDQEQYLTPQGRAALKQLKEKAKQAGKELTAEYLQTFYARYRDPSAPPIQPANEVEIERFTVADVADSLATLHARGNQYGIFVLSATENYPVIDSILLSKSMDKNNAKSRYSIFGSLEELKNRKSDSTSSPACVYLSYSSTKIRLCDYSASEDWWKDLESK